MKKKNLIDSTYNLRRMKVLPDFSFMFLGLLLLLLIIYIVLTPVIYSCGRRPQYPVFINGDYHTLNNIPVIYCHEDGIIYVGNMKLESDQQLTEKIEDLIIDLEYYELKLYIKASLDVSYKRIEFLLDSVSKMGFNKVVLLGQTVNGFSKI